MTISDIGIVISRLVADTETILDLSMELGEEVEPDSREYHRTHAIYTIAEHLLILLNDIDEALLKLLYNKEG